jgi:uncharacterized protein (TIGR03084 family)
MRASAIAADLRDEQEALDRLVSTLTDEQWRLPTASPGWSVADQIGHLAYFDGTAALAVTDSDAFVQARDALIAAAIGGESGAGDELTLAGYRTMRPSQLLDAWRAGRGQLAAAAATLDDDTRVAWYGPSMSAKSFLTARLMECWAHGQDIVDTLGAGALRPPTDRLRHIAQLGYITRGWSYLNRGEQPPEGTVRLMLTAPSGEVWSWGPDDADDTVSGPAEDFCLVVTQRRHVDDTALRTCDLGRHWLLRAQAFAGGPSDGPAARSGS